MDLNRYVEALGASIYELAEQKDARFLGAILGALLVLLITPNGVLNGNEEYYFQLAHRYLHPLEPGEHSAVLGTRAHMVFFMLPFGLAIDWLGYSAAQILGRVVVIGLYLFSLLVLLRQLRFQFVEVIVLICVFMLLDQHILGREWMFDGVEAKSLAYPFVLLAIAAVLKNRWYLAFSLLAAATCFHFLVGGFWAGILLLAGLWNGAGLSRMLKAGLVYGLLTSPLAYVIVSSYGPTLVSTPPDASLPPMAWITGVYRNATLAAPFSSIWVFIGWSPRVGLLLALLIVSTVLLTRRYEDLRLLSRVVFLAIVYLTIVLFLSLLLSVYDRDYILAAFFPFRPGSLALFLLLAGLIVAFRNMSTDNKSRLAILSISSLVSLSMVVPTALNRGVVKMVHEVRKHDRQAAVYSYISEHTSDSDIFLIHESLENEFWSFERDVFRPSFSFRKFTSVDKAGVFEWYRREEERNSISRGGCSDSDLFRKNFLLVPASYPASHQDTCGVKVFNDTNYALIRVTNRADQDRLDNEQ